STNTPASRSSVTTLTFVSAPSIVPGKTGAEISLHKQLVEDFSCVSKLKAGMVEGERNGVVYGASGDLEEHFDILRPDFAGLPVLCFAHMQLIVCLRRRLDVAENEPVFLRLWAEEHEFLTAHLNSRWLISACDTFVDYGSERQKAAAMSLVILVNTLRLAGKGGFVVFGPMARRGKVGGVGGG